MKGILIIAHGSRTEEANSVFSNVVKYIRSNTPDAIVIGTSIKFNQLGIKEIILELIKRGVDDLVIVPYFLFDGSHVTNDIPNEVEQTLRNYPNVKVTYTTSIGMAPQIKGIVLDLIKEEMR